MDEYIKREEAIEAVKYAWGKGLEPSQYIEIIPAADVSQVRHGRWVDKGEYAVCTECDGRSGTQYDGVEPIPLTTQFCPNCGAKMDGGADWMDVREKLVEILRKPIFPHELVDPTEAVADYLLDNGVTVQEWISVDDELPEVGGYVVCIAKENPFSRFMPMVARIGKHGWVDPMTEQYISEVTHWMPMPPLPKGE